MKGLCRILAAGIIWGVCSWKCHAVQAANQFVTVSCNHPGIIAIEVRGDDFHVLAPGKDEDFTAE